MNSNIAAPAASANAEASGADVLTVPRGFAGRLALNWLWLGVAALVASGLFSILLVLSRTPQIASVMPLADFFHVALVVHVDLSVLVWFLAFAGVLWSLNGGERLSWLAQGGWGLAALGAGVMALAPFFGRGSPLMSNYIPVLDEPMFLTGLVVFAVGIALFTLRALISAAQSKPSGVLSVGLNAAAVATLIALISFAWSWYAMPRFITGKDYYELLFWGGGHALQFAYALIMLVAWTTLAAATGARLPLTPRLTQWLFVLGVLPVFMVPAVYVAYDVRAGEFRGLMTWLMQFGGALPMFPFMLAVLIGLWRAPPATPSERPLRAALMASVLLFGVGGVFAFMIQGSNTRIPAHYHGSIVGITLALMGLTYYLLPRFGFRTPQSRLAFWQPYVYAGGQFLHISGLAWAGGHGTERKVVAATQTLASTGDRIAMGVMGVGGLVAIIGGVLFLVIVLRAAFGTAEAAAAPGDGR